MTKKDLIVTVNKIANKISDMETSLADLQSEAKSITRLIDDIPDDPSEITDEDDDD